MGVATLRRYHAANDELSKAERAFEAARKKYEDLESAIHIASREVEEAYEHLRALHASAEAAKPKPEPEPAKEPEPPPPTKVEHDPSKSIREDSSPNAEHDHGAAAPSLASAPESAPEPTPEAKPEAAQEPASAPAAPVTAPESPKAKKGRG